MQAKRITIFLAALALLAAGLTPAIAQSLDPTSIPKYASPLTIPPAMPKVLSTQQFDSYAISVRQFKQQMLPQGLPKTTVWGYGSTFHPGTFNTPAFTIEAKVDKPVFVNWANELVDSKGKFLPHLLPVDATLHWANPPGGNMGKDRRPPADPTDPYWTDPYIDANRRYTGPVPIITHLHGAHVRPDSDGYPEAWYLPNAKNIPAMYAQKGTHYDTVLPTLRGSAIFKYSNDQRATTLWFHDHSLGMTRLNVYAGPTGFYLLRGGADDVVTKVGGGLAKLPGPAPKLNDPKGARYYEIPLAIQDKSFNADGSLFFPADRAFFEGLLPSDFVAPFFFPDAACTGPSDVAPIWNPEFFGNAMVVNGKTWPFQNVEPRRYRFRLLNASDSRFLNLSLQAYNKRGVALGEIPFYVIGTDGGFLPEVVQVQTGTYTILPGGAPTSFASPDQALLIALAERMDVIVDFSALPPGTAKVRMLNTGPDEPFGGFPAPASNPDTTGQVMEFRLVPLASPDNSTPPQNLILPAPAVMPPVNNTRKLSLNEEESATVKVLTNPDGSWATPVQLACDNPDAVPFGPTAAKLGTVDAGGFPMPMPWMDPISENPAMGDTEVWEIYNFTADAHPIHVHMVQFEVINREQLATDTDGMSLQPAQLTGSVTDPEPWESGRKDTVIVYPGQLTRIRATFDIEGLFVWHCHILSHEDNEMMRPYHVGPIPLPPGM